MDQPHPPSDSDAPAPDSRQSAPTAYVVIGPDGQPVAMQRTGGDGGDQDSGDGADGGDGERHVTELIEQPAKVMRIGSMIRQLLDEVKAAPLDEASRARLAQIHASSITELEQGLAPELVEELERLSLPFTSETPSESELRIAQAQLVGWLEGLFHGIQTAIYAQQMAARAQLEQMRRALPPGVTGGLGMPGQPGEDSGQTGNQDTDSRSGGMYL
jgi:hypothetical protein